VERAGTGLEFTPIAEGRALVIAACGSSRRGLSGQVTDMCAARDGDALLGAVALGDPRQHFPPSDARWQDAGKVSTCLRIHPGLLVQAAARIVTRGCDPDRRVAPDGAARVAI